MLIEQKLVQTLKIKFKPNLKQSILDKWEKKDFSLLFTLDSRFSIGDRGKNTIIVQVHQLLLFWSEPETFPVKPKCQSFKTIFYTELFEQSAL